MGLSTPRRPIAVEELLPEVVPYRRMAVRLHPRAGEPGVRDSSVGGPPLWPADEEWPVCPPGDPEGDPMVPVVQVFRRDVPQLPFPVGTDVLQVLWCACEHDHYSPRAVVRWRNSQVIGAVAARPPVPAGAEADHVPQPCVVHPEEVVEYPSWDLPEPADSAIRPRVDALFEETGWRYHYHLSYAPGIKLGGYPGWTQEPGWPDCGTCGARMEHLLTVASWEWDGESWRTWLPVEERRSDDGPDFPRNEAAEAGHNPHGLMLGDAGGVYIFECRACPGRPYAERFDCS
ncbi:DUF1963 domain-containing protein (plasmid) [Embleya sp. NBC_00888]|uniref:DUF1963 domain-containing protein n=1 Tax=Embleya sp. NBC_00888 TaxID=2975960 RepID=UPI002F915051|nr:DUF1963 domain-containing protein [Embleya sp. NBC_00888]